MKNKKSLPTRPDASQPTSDDQLIEFVKNNKVLLIAVAVAILVIFAISIFCVNYSDNQEELAWAKYAETLNDGADAAALREILSSVRGSSAEPLLLYRLSILEFTEDNLEAAKETFDSLKESYGDHYLFKRPQLAPSFQVQLETELEWNSRHPLGEALPDKKEQPENADPTNTAEEAAGEDSADQGKDS